LPFCDSAWIHEHEHRVNMTSRRWLWPTLLWTHVGANANAAAANINIAAY